MRKGLLVVISGFSGAGKGTLVRELMERYPQRYALSISATTRSPRSGEKHARDYFFISKEEFQDMISREEFIEYAQYIENYYGTPKSYVLSQMQEGKDVILEIEVQGALEIKKKHANAIMIFIAPPNKQVLYERLLKRGTEKQEQIYKRLKRAKEEAESIKEYDYIIINDTLEEAIEDLHQLIQSQHFLIKHNQEMIHNIQEDICKEEL